MKKKTFNDLKRGDYIWLSPYIKEKISDILSRFPGQYIVTKSESEKNCYGLGWNQIKSTRARVEDTEIQRVIFANHESAVEYYENYKNNIDKYVDLGLRSKGFKLLFAKSNYGANAPEEFGDLLTLEDAFKKHTDMPTAHDLIFLESLKGVYTDNYNNSGIAGIVYEGKGKFSKNTLFLPIAGFKDEKSDEKRKFIPEDQYFEHGFYWSSSIPGGCNINPVFLAIYGWKNSQYNKAENCYRTCSYGHPLYSVRSVIVIADQSC